MMVHLTKLQDIANANNGTRAVGIPGYFPQHVESLNLDGQGTPGYDASVEYVEKALRDKSFDVATP